MESLQMQFDNASYVIDFAHPLLKAHYEASIFRNYKAQITASEKKDISYVVNMLGIGSLSKIAQSKSLLKSAGKRIDHIHPLRFLQCIFSDEKMTASMHAMQGRSWIWKEFIEGLDASLNEESARDNLLPEQIADFAANLKVQGDRIIPTINAKLWNKFISILIDIIPRNIDANKYQDM
jgi:hypothetical protein